MDLRVTARGAGRAKISSRPGDAISSRHSAPGLSRTGRAAALGRNLESAL
jgi:hypothetical protein